jgi:hypothetical protein
VDRKAVTGKQSAMAQVRGEDRAAETLGPLLSIVVNSLQDSLIKKLLREMTMGTSEKLGIAVSALVLAISLVIMIMRCYALARHLTTRWQSANGRLLTIKRQDLHRAYGTDKYHVANVTYEYRVGQQTLVGERLSLFDSFAFSLVSSAQLRAYVDELEEAFRRSEPVHVYFDPGRPSRSVLATSVPLHDLTIFLVSPLFGILAATAGLLMFFLVVLD